MTRRAWLVRSILVATAWLLLFPSQARPQRFGFVYTANALSSDTVSVINPATNRVIGTIPVGVQPHGVAATPDGALVYVANFGPAPACRPATVSVIDTATNKVIATVPVSFTAFDIAVAPAGASAYVAHGCSSTLSVIDTATNSVTATIDTGPAPAGTVSVALTPNGAFAYVTTFGDSVVVIDLATNAVIATIPVGGCPSGIAITPDGGFAYVANPAPANVPHSAPDCISLAGNGSVSVISTATNTVVASLDLPFSSSAGSVAITPDGASAYVTGCGPGVCVIETATNTVATTFSPRLGSDTQGIAFNGAFAYIGCCGGLPGGGICVVDPATNTTTATIDTGGKCAYKAAVASVPLDNFKCYKAKTASGTPRFQHRTMALADEFESKNTAILKPVGICNPVSENGERILDSTAHLECYTIRDVKGQPKFTSQNVQYENASGTDTLTLAKAGTLCVPARTDGQSTALKLDKFKCYTAKTAAGTARFQKRTVALTDEFGTKSTTVVKPVTICNPVNEDGAGITTPLAHLECYKISDVKGQPKFTARNVSVQNAFGSETLTVQKPDTLCVPSLQDDTP